MTPLSSFFNLRLLSSSPQIQGGCTDLIAGDIDAIVVVGTLLLLSGIDRVFRRHLYLSVWGTFLLFGIATAHEVGQ